MLTLAQDCFARLHPDPAAIALQMLAAQGRIHAEALTIALARQMPRPEAEHQVKALLADASTGATPLASLALQAHLELDWAAIINAGLGQASTDACAFARKTVRHVECGTSVVCQW